MRRMYGWYSRGRSREECPVLGRHRLRVQVARELGIVSGTGLEHTAGPRYANFLNDRSRLAQCRGSRLGVSHDLGVDLEVPEVHRERNPPSLDPLRTEREIELGRDRSRIVAMLPGHDVHHEGGVGDGARHRSVGEVRVKRARSAARHPPVRGLEAKDAAARGGDPDRAPDVRSVRERRHPCGERYSRPSARSARREIEVPGIARDAPEIGVGDAEERELGRRGAREQNGAGAKEPVHEGEALPGTMVFVKARAVGRDFSLHVVEVLDDDREAFEGPWAGSTAGVPLLRLPGLVEGAVKEGAGECVDLRLDGLDARDEARDELDRGEAPFAEAIAGLDGVQIAQVGVGGHRLQCYGERSTGGSAGTARGGTWLGNCPRGSRARERTPEPRALPCLAALRVAAHPVAVDLHALRPVELPHVPPYDAVHARLQVE